MARYQYSFDRPFTVIQSAAAGQNMAGTLPAVEPTPETNGVRYAEAVAGVAGLFHLHARWDLDIRRITIVLPGDQTTCTVNIIEDGLTVEWANFGAGVTSVILEGPMPIRANGDIQIITTGAPTDVITAKVTAIRANHTRIR